MRLTRRADPQAPAPSTVTPAPPAPEAPRAARVRYQPPPPRAPDAPVPTLGVMTMARDEGPMLRRWVDHYARQVGADRVLVVDDNSTDGSTDDLPCPVIRIPPLVKRPFEAARMGLLAGISQGLLESYDAMLFCDADEFVVPEPRKYATLLDFVADRPATMALGVVGLNVVHDAAHEPALREDEPILGQRHYAKFVPLMCKPALKWVPAPWAHASHGIRCPYTIDPELYMFHMKFADRDRLLRSAELRHHLNVTEGRALKTSWAKSGDEMVALLDGFMAGADLAAAPPFRPGSDRLAKIVEHRDGMWRAVGDGQAIAMRKRPLVRIPDRFVGLA